MLIDEFLCKREVLGKRAPHSFTPPLSVVGVSNNHMDMNGLNMKVDVNIIPLGSYDCLIGMDWLEKHHAILDCYKNTIMFLDEEGKEGKIQGIPRVVVVREISAMQLKKSSMDGC
jgi:hypothetical protein